MQAWYISLKTHTYFIESSKIIGYFIANNYGLKFQVKPKYKSNFMKAMIPI